MRKVTMTTGDSSTAGRPTTLPPADAEPTPAPRRKRSRLAWFSSPRGAASGWIATVVSLVLGVVFFLRSQPKRELVYYPNPASAVIVQSGTVSRLTTSYNGEEIHSDITAAQVELWNIGNQSIRPENVLRPLTFDVEDGVPILEATVRRTTRDVIGMSLDASSIGRGSLGVSWKILEPGDGAILQIVYAGEPALDIRANGVLEGQKAIRLSNQQRQSMLPLRESVRPLIWIVPLAILSTVISSILTSAAKKKLKLPDGSAGSLGFVLILLAIVVVLLVVLFWFTDPPPPFPF